MFLGQGATRYALNPTVAKDDPVRFEDVRCSLIGNSFHAGVFSMILSQLFHKKGFLAEKPTAQDIVDRQGLYPGEKYVQGLQCDLGRPPSYHRLDGQRRGLCHSTCEAAKAARSERGTPELERLTLNALLRWSDFQGSDVRMDTGELMKPSQWPRRAIDPAKWSWYSILAAPFHDEEHINLLEVRASHLMMRWRSRTPARIKSRFFHLLDSQVAVAVLCKGRSSSWKMNRLLRRIGALTMAGGFVYPHGDIRCPYGTPQIKAQGNLKVAIADGERSHAGADREKA